ncbi:GntR family transcriptional regulator [Isoptericola sp. CG 20/1183]|uniref:GntR family transcriptional regulator n=1 Tax=Isoptericola halotolerans TaxID=300560 RepID=A0ABX5EJ15_9MICO|nr:MULTISPECIES: GntR family transcriptional regulator [Isoptericola]PRZ09636.1 GntR family transcriptional regulator [Isoptericola sp. CG 20/1183]PRZ10437.1 GntR family transcriptional regulator [Isoptericola halotolerans]
MTTSPAPHDGARPSLRETAYESLKSRIIGLDLHPGQRLVERDLATETGVSRVPLREALHQLEREGLVVLVPRQGALVAPFTRDDVEHLFEVRESVEVLAFRLAALRRSAADLAAMSAAVDAARDALARRDDAATAAANAGFHAVVVQACGNPLLQSMLAPLDARVRWLFHLTKRRDTREQCEEHAAMLAAIEARDADGVGALAHAHVASGREPSLALAETWASSPIDPVAVTRTRNRGRHGS